MRRSGRLTVSMTLVSAMIMGLLLVSAPATAADEGNLVMVDRTQITPELRAEWRANKGNRDYVPSVSITTKSGDARAPSDPMIQYDDGVPAQRSGTVGYSVGNQFNVDAGGNSPLATAHTVSTVQFSMAGLFGSSDFVSFFGPVVGTAAPVITSALVGSLVQGMNTVVFSPPLTGNSASFLGGIYNSGSTFCSGNTTVPSTCNGVGLSIGQNGLGFHAMEINDVVGTDFTPRPGQNAIFRVRGANLPIELMAVTVE